MPLFEQLQTLISNHMEDLEYNRLPVISRHTNYLDRTDPTNARRAAEAQPEARRQVQRGRRPPVTPDVFIEQERGGASTMCGWKRGGRRACSFSPTIASFSPAGQANAETREYIKRKINSAQWLIDSISRRRSTLTRVAQAIVDHQTDFLNKGPESIQPLKMQQIADKVGVHVTTVSRAVDDKWIQTPRGIFPLKRFFCGGAMGPTAKRWLGIRSA